MKNNHCLPLGQILLLSCLGICLFNACGLPVDTLIDRTSLPTCNPEKMAEFEFAKNKSEGLLVTNPTNKDIGYPKAFYDGWANYYWQPVNGQKTTACGTYVRFSIYDGQSGIVFGNDSADDEYDWNLTMVPDPEFNYITDHVLSLVGNSEDWVKPKINGVARLGIQAELTPDESLYNNPWFPNLGHDNSSFDVVSQHVCVYGPWIMDVHHNNRPEIHPAENIWWRTVSGGKTVYTIFGLQDDSNRYDQASDFVFDNDFGVGWKPWATVPMTSSYSIPFEYSGDFADHLVVEIEELKAHNVVTATVANASDSDDGNTHLLKFQQTRPSLESALKPSDVLVEVKELQPLGVNIGVRFVDVCKKPDGHVIGYIQLFSAYGKDINGNEGYHILKVTLTPPTNKLPIDILERGN